MNKHTKTINFKSIFVATSLLILPLGCGSGGGDDNFIGAAKVSLNVSPNQIDTADRTEIKIGLTDVSDTGVALKVFYPNSLDYVPGSAYIVADGVKSNINPDYNESDGDDGIYLVFFIAVSQFDQSRRGEVTFQLDGESALTSGTIEIDADIDDPLIANSEEFDPQDANFAAEASAGIEVKE